SIATGGVGGVYNPLGGAFASLWTKHLGPRVTVTAETTTASVDNLVDEDKPVSLLGRYAVAGEQQKSGPV
ncbi:MAG: TAXI family TRAP transporter solute-binding subunit, partial [Candidatus Caldarchaeum sp.]